MRQMNCYVKTQKSSKEHYGDRRRKSERGIIDIETLQATNRSLIETLDEVRKIQAEGADKRRAAEAELVKIEDELKKKLLEIRGQE